MGKPALPIGTWGEIFVSQEPNGNWIARARYRGTDGVTRQVKASARSKSAARLSLTARLSSQGKSTHSGEVTASTTLSELADLWIDDRRKAGRRDSTLSYYGQGVEYYVKPHLGQVSLGEISKNQLSTFFDRMDALEAATAYEHSRKVLSGMFALAVERDALEANPVQRMRSRARHGKDTEGLTLEQVREVRRLMTSWETRPGPRKADGTVGKNSGPTRGNPVSSVLTMLLATGARIGEVLAVRWRDIDLDSPTPTITISGTIPNTGALVRQNSTKTTSGTRTLVLPSYAEELLRSRHVAARDSLADGTGCDLVFQTRTGSPLRPTNVRKQWRNALAGTELAWVHPHTIRAVVATAIDRATDTKTAAAVLGHSSEEITRRHYVLPPDVAPDVRSALDQFGP